MLTTEDEARTKLCPGNPVLALAIRETVHRAADVSRLCVASNCMAWRWANDAAGEPLYRRSKIGEAHYDNAPLGYCGFIGKPEGA